MDALAIQRAMLRDHNLRIEAEMSKYVAQQFADVQNGLTLGAIPVIGGNARTGMPLRKTIELTALTNSEVA